MSRQHTSLSIGEESAWKPLGKFGSAVVNVGFRSSDDWPCPRCGLIGCQHDPDDLPTYRGAFDTEGRH